MPGSPFLTAPVDGQSKLGSTNLWTTDSVGQLARHFLAYRLDGVDEEDLDEGHAARHALLITQQVYFGILKVALGQYQPCAKYIAEFTMAIERT